MIKADFIARTLTGVVVFGFLIAAIFNVLDYFIVKLLLFLIFSILVIVMFVSLFKNENHPEV